MQNIERNDGKVNANDVTIEVQQPVAVKFEKSFEGEYPVAMTPVKWNTGKTELSFDFVGNGFVIKGDASQWDSKSTYVFDTELYLDGKLIETPKLPVSYTTRRYDIAWRYRLPKAKHSVKFKILNPSTENTVRVSEAIIYSDKPVDGIQANIDGAKNNVNP